AADREDHAVQRPADTVVAQQREELAPAFAVGGLIGVLRGVAAGGVEEHRFFGEPPVAVAGAADAGTRAPAGPLFERESQTGVHQRGRFSRTGRADEDVPRQVVEAPAAALLQRRDGFLEALAQLGRLGQRLLFLGPRR